MSYKSYQLLNILEKCEDINTYIHSAFIYDSIKNTYIDTNILTLQVYRPESLI